MWLDWPCFGLSIWVVLFSSIELVINFLRGIMIGDSAVILSTLAVEKEVSVGTKVSISSAGTNLRCFFLKKNKFVWKGLL
jgi:uncharacterized membrane protein